MGRKLLADPPGIAQRRQFSMFDHFTEYTTAKTWTSTLTNSSAPTVSATILSGVLVMVNASAADDAVYVASTGTWFKWETNKSCVAECLLQFTEANTDDANIVFGFSSSVSATLLGNSNGGLPTSFSGALIWKLGNTTVWKTLSSQSTTQNANTTAYTAGQSGYTRLRIECTVNNGVMEAAYFIDQGSGLRQMVDNTSRALPIKDTITLSSPSAMKLVVGVKNGSANAETLNLDYLAGYAHEGNFVASA